MLESRSFDDVFIPDDAEILEMGSVHLSLRPRTPNTIDIFCNLVGAVLSFSLGQCEHTMRLVQTVFMYFFTRENVHSW